MAVFEEGRFTFPRDVPHTKIKKGQIGTIHAVYEPENRDPSYKIQVTEGKRGGKVYDLSHRQITGEYAR